MPYHEQPDERRPRPWAAICGACFAFSMIAGCAIFQTRGGVACDMTVVPLDLPEPASSPVDLPIIALSLPAVPDFTPAETAPVANNRLPRIEEAPPVEQGPADLSPDSPNTAPEPEDHEYRIQPFDRLYIEVFGETDISKVYAVSAAGTIKHPLLNVVPVTDYTLAQAEHHLTELLKRDFLVSPRVSIRVEQSSGRRVTLLGEVKKPGTLYISPEQRFSLLNVIAATGGFGELAAKSRVRIIRSVDGEERVIKVNCDDLLKGRGESGDVDLMPGDVIMVPETFF